MTSFPFLSLFSSSLILGTFMSLSGPHWLFIWMGLELNMLSFIPLLTFSNNNQETEAAMKYFLAQALGSGLLLLGASTYLGNQSLLMNQSLAKTLLLLGLMTKLGMPPCHFWFPSVMATISWPMCITLSTWQKLAPSILIFYLMSPSLKPLIFILIALASIISSLGGLNQSQLRPLLAYSSIGHMSWMLAASIFSYSISLVYLFIYIIISTPLMFLFWRHLYYLSSSINNLMMMNKLFLPSLLLLMFSLGGVPPFLGFFPKWMVIQSISPFSPTLTFIILLGSAINLFYYLNLMFLSFLKHPKTPMIMPHTPPISTFPMTIAYSTIGLGPIIFTMIYALTILH